jgi:hypothetical protein
MEISYANSLDVTHGISFGQFLLLLLCSALLAAAAFLMLLPLPKAVNVLLNYIISFLSVYVVFGAAGKLLNPFAAWILFTVFYALFWGIFLLFRYIFYPERREEKSRLEQREEAEYVNRF